MMYSTFERIEEMILKHIKDIENSATYGSREAQAEFYKAKSIALQSLVELKKAEKR